MPHLPADLARLALDQSADLIGVKDAGGVYHLANNALAALSGADPDLLLGATDHDLFPAPLAAHLAEDGRAALAGSRMVVCEACLDGASGPRWFQVSQRPLGQETDAAILLQARDVTDTKLQESRLLDLARSTSTMVGAQFYPTLVESLARVLGTDYAFIGRPLPDTPGRIRTLAVFAGGRPAADLEYDLAGSPCETVLAGQACIHPSGVRALFPNDALLAEREIEGYAGAPLADSDGVFRGLIVALSRKPLADPGLAATLITAYATRAAAEMERQDAVARLTRSEREKSAILAGFAEVSVEYLDPDLRIIWTNNALNRFPGKRPEEVVGLRCFEALSAGDAPCPDCSALKALATGLSQQGEQSMPDGRTFLTRSNPMTDGAGRVTGVVHLSLDITARKKVDRELVLAMQAAEAASRSKSEFLANMSHEIRTPMNGVLGMLQLLGTTPLGAEQRDFVATALSSAKSLLNVINDILDLSKIEAGKAEVRAAPFALRDLADMVVKLFAQQAAVKGLDLTCEVAESVPPLVVGDSARLRQILFNLVGNALKFTPTGEVRLTVDPDPVPAAPGRTALLFRVIDSGVGIPAERLSDIFQAFTQVDGSYTRRFEGTGLGLTIVKRLVELLEGRIDVASRPGRGTIFSLRFDWPLPPTKALADEQATPPLPALAADLPRAARAMRVLVVDDNPVSLLATSAMLEKLGHRPASAQSGEEALEAYLTGPFDAVLMDIQMPGEDGVAVSRRLRAAGGPNGGRAVPIVALTAHVLDGYRERILAAGLDDYLGKPLGMADLAGLMARLAGS